MISSSLLFNINLIFTNQDKVDEHRFHDHLIPVIHTVFHVYVANNCDELALD